MIKFFHRESLQKHWQDEVKIAIIYMVYGTAMGYGTNFTNFTFGSLSLSLSLVHSECL